MLPHSCLSDVEKCLDADQQWDSTQFLNKKESVNSCRLLHFQSSHHFPIHTSLTFLYRKHLSWLKTVYLFFYFLFFWCVVISVFVSDRCAGNLKSCLTS